MNMPLDIIDEATVYVHILFDGLISTIVYNWFASILCAFFDSRTPLHFLTIASITNIVLDLVFIINLHLGVGGTSLATIIS